jgi:hypothetical protein
MAIAGAWLDPVVGAVDIWLHCRPAAYEDLRPAIGSSSIAGY